MSVVLLKKANSWSEFTALLAPLGRKQQGNAFELLTELYLQIDPVYRSKLKTVWHHSQIPSNVRNKLGLPYPEIGVDLVAETREGEYWAIQCKYHHDPSRNLTYGELKSFLDITSRLCAGKFSNLLAVSSAHGYSVNLQKHAPEVQYCLSDHWQSLDSTFFNQARQVLQKQAPKYAKRTPRPHQKTAIKNAVDHFVAGRAARGKLIHPCGTGKSLIGYWIAEALDGKTMLVALPSLYLVRQTLTDWTKESLANGESLDWMVVCSEDTITDLSKGDPSMRFQEIGVDVTTDVDRIAKFLRKRPNGRKVIFTTYQSGYVTAEAARKANRVFDIGIFDEAHRTVGQKDALFSHLISEENIRIRKRVFMTATERRYQGSSDSILSMDDIDAYGETFDLMTFREALEQSPPILSDYKIITMVVSQSEIRHLIEENILVKPDRGRWDDETEARTLAAMIALRKVMRDYNANHALTFHNSIAKAEAFQRSQERFNEAAQGFGPVDCFHVSSKVGTGERKAELDRFRDSRKALITNAKCLTEGVDVPTIDAVLFAETKRSTIDIVQAAGRALRPAEGKKRGYIVVPVLVDENASSAAEQAFQDILVVLRAMASNDDRIIDYFRSIDRGKRPTGADVVVEFNVPDPIRVRFDEFVGDIETRAWHRLAKLSWMPFEEARKFAQSLGLSSAEMWWQYCRGERSDLSPKPEDLPSSPNSIYRDMGWIDWGDWLGTGFVCTRKRKFLEYQEARSFVHSLKLGNLSEWRAYCRGVMKDLPARPDNIPSNPATVYSKRGWVGMGDWLGTGAIAPQERVFRDFKSARKFVQSLGINSQGEWRRYVKGRSRHLPPKPDDIPSWPDGVYNNQGWVSWGDWLGTGTKYRLGWLEFEEAKRFVHSLGLWGRDQWNLYCNGEIKHLPPRPTNIPKSPFAVYRNGGWKGWGDWMGTNNKPKKGDRYRNFLDARDFVRSLGLTSYENWRDYCKGKFPGLPDRPDDIPVDPRHMYLESGWISWPDWLGTAKADKSNASKGRKA